MLNQVRQLVEAGWGSGWSNFGLVPCDLRALFENIVEDESGQKGKNKGKIKSKTAGEVGHKRVGRGSRGGGGGGAVFGRGFKISAAESI